MADDRPIDPAGAATALRDPAPLRDSPKSRRTRARILDEAMRLFAELGYAAATNARIAEAAGLTRGAMLYHFPDRDSLAEAAIAHIQGRRVALLHAAQGDLPPGADVTEHAIDSYWRLLHEPAFVAFAELEVAARTDESLAAQLAPAQAQFDRGQVGDHFLKMLHAGAGPRFQASRDLARFLLEGLAHAKLTYDGEGRAERLIEVLKRATHILNRKGGHIDLWPE